MTPHCFLYRQVATISHLPDKVEQWPNDPYAIIGVERSAERTDVRRAYSRLIREFRPETHPVHFQALHEAYEVVLAIVDGGGAKLLAPGSGPVFDFDDHSAASSAAEKSTATAEGLWQQFTETPDDKVVYAATQLAESEAPIADVFLLLYWMRRLHPEIAPGDDRISWLQRGLKQHPHDGRFVDLIIAEFRSDRLLCTNPQTRHISEQIACPDSLARYLSVRWDGIGRSNAWRTLKEEIDQARTLFGIDQTENWARLLITAYEIVSFSTDELGQHLLDDVKDEIESFPDLQLALSEDLESLDQWQLFRIQRGGQHGNAIVDFVAGERFTDLAAVQQATLKVIERWVDRPRTALKLLTSTAADYPEAFWQFVQYVAITDLSDPPADDLLLANDIADFFPRTYNDSYAHMRLRILDFCRRECIGPTQFFRYLNDVADGIGLGTELLEALQSDLPLYVTIQSMHVFVNTASGENSD